MILKREVCHAKQNPIFKAYLLNANKVPRLVERYWMKFKSA